MALFDNATYKFYSDTLGRSEVPDEATFDKYALEERLYVKSLLDDGLISERGENGVDSAVCMMVEEDYKNFLALTGDDAPKVSESIGGYSFTRSTKVQELAAERDTTTLAQRKYKWLSLYCDIEAGVL
ncbi:MAG: hypothetical protein NC548_31045 [Lachnospiraceae bacterium]|nr:hypothetical protein [Lachnospiraceae bacterium]MCM1232069.1 hypothetical protein [Ruminococcus flavefaciens]